MIVGRFGTEVAGREVESEAFADELESDEEVRFSWTATNVRWANQGRTAPDATTFAATDRRVLFETADGTTAIGYERVRAVKTDPANDGPDLSTAFLGCGGLCLLVGVLVATDDFVNGVGLVLLSVALLAAGTAVGDAPETATVTIVIGNERQRLSFSADESVGSKLDELAREQ